jgi:hypothetical protein
VPFPGDGFGEVLVAHLTREPEAPRTHNPNIPPELEAIVLRCLKKKKEERFQSMNDLMAALLDPGPHYQAWLAGQPAPKAPENLGANGSMMLPSQMMPSAIMPAIGPMMGSMPSGPVAATPFVPMSQPPPSGMVPALQQGWGPPMQPMQPMGAAGASRTPPGLQAPGRTPPGLQAPLPQSSRTPTNMISANMAAPGASSAAISSPSRPSTLQAAAGEATGRRRPRSVLIGFAGAMAFGVLSVVTARQLVARPVPQVVPAASDKVAVERVRIVVKTTPSSAEVVPSGDGLEVKGARPFSLAAKKGGGTITLKIKAPGYKEETRTVEPTNDQTLSVELSKLVEEAPPIAPVETASTPAGGKKKKGDKADSKKTEIDSVAAKDPKPTKTGKGADPVKEAKPAAEPKGKDAKPAKGPDPIKEAKPDKGKDAKPAGDAKGGKKKKKNEDLLPPVF